MREMFRRSRSLVLALAVLPVGLGGSLAFGQRPLPTFKSVRFFNGATGTTPMHVSEKHTTTGGTSTAVPLTPSNPPPNAVATLTSVPSLYDVSSVVIETRISATCLITLTASVPSGSGGRIVGLDVILKDTGTADVTTEGRMLWYTPSPTTGMPYWSWDAVTTTNVCPRKPGTKAGIDRPLEEETLYSGSGPETNPSVTYTLSPSGTGSLAAPTVTDVDWLALPPTTYTTATSAQAAATGFTTQTIAVNTPSTDHLHVVYFVLKPDKSIFSGAIVQSSTAPYWYFK